MKTRQFAQLSYTSAAATFYVSGTEFTDRADGQDFWMVSHSTNDGMGHTTVKYHTLSGAVEYADHIIDMMVERVYYLRAIDGRRPTPGTYTGTILYDDQGNEIGRTPPR